MQVLKVEETVCGFLKNGVKSSLDLKVDNTPCVS